MEKGMLLSADMVRATLDNRKRMTRRMNRLKEINESPDSWQLVNFEENACLKRGLIETFFIATFINKDSGVCKNIKCPWAPGDILWFRETYTEIDGEIFYRADGYPDVELRDRFEQTKSKKIKWKPSLFMPRRAARLFGDTQELRIERLLDITEEEAILEGFTPLLSGSGEVIRTARERFINYFMGLNSKAKTPLDPNPWVWVIEYEEAEDYA